MPFDQNYCFEFDHIKFFNLNMLPRQFQHFRQHFQQHSQQQHSQQHFQQHFQQQHFQQHFQQQHCQQQFCQQFFFSFFSISTPFSFSFFPPLYYFFFMFDFRCVKFSNSISRVVYFLFRTFNDRFLIFIIAEFCIITKKLIVFAFSISFSFNGICDGKTNELKM